MSRVEERKKREHIQKKDWIEYVKIYGLLTVSMVILFLLGHAWRKAEEVPVQPIPVAEVVTAAEDKEETQSPNRPEDKNIPEEAQASPPESDRKSNGAAASGLAGQKEKTWSSQELEELLSSMSLEEKIGQMIMGRLTALNGGTEPTAMTETVKTTLDTYHIGGVIFFEENIRTPDQVREFIAALQAERQVPLLIGVDEEGGPIRRIGNNPAMNTAEIPSMSEIGATEDSQSAYEVGATIGGSLKSLGFNVNFAPVADVLSEEGNPAVGERSFGSDPVLVSSMVGAEVRGLQDNGVSAVLKHFPGLGGSSGDPHQGPATTERSLTEMREAEFLPFEAGMDSGCDFIMAGHIAAPQVTGDNTPSSLSETMITKILRDGLGYDGVVITDALDMEAVTQSYSPGQAAVMAVQAGADILLMPPDIPAVCEALQTAIQDGSLTEERINASVMRILKLKLS